MKRSLLLIACLFVFLAAFLVYANFKADEYVQENGWFPNSIGEVLPNAVREAAWSAGDATLFFEGLRTAVGQTCIVSKYFSYGAEAAYYRTQEVFPVLPQEVNIEFLCPEEAGPQAIECEVSKATSVCFEKEGYWNAELDCKKFGKTMNCSVKFLPASEEGNVPLKYRKPRVFTDSRFLEEASELALAEIEEEDAYWARLIESDFVSKALWFYSSSEEEKWEQDWQRSWNAGLLYHLFAQVGSEFEDLYFNQEYGDYFFDGTTEFDEHLQKMRSEIQSNENAACRELLGDQVGKSDAENELKEKAFRLRAMHACVFMNHNPQWEFLNALRYLNRTGKESVELGRASFAKGAEIDFKDLSAKTGFNIKAEGALGEVEKLVEIEDNVLSVKEGVRLKVAAALKDGQATITFST